MRKRRPQGRALPPLHQEEPIVANPQLRAAVMEVIDTQLRAGTPPETQQTFDRLVALGYTREGARQLLGHVVVHEIFTVMKQGKPYNQERFIAALQRLPALPDDSHGAIEDAERTKGMEDTETQGR